jgi:hypothetical protein
VQRYLLHEGVVLFALDTSGGVFAILGRDVPRNTRNARRSLLGAFQNYLNSITFLSHGYVIFLNGSAKIGNRLENYNGRSYLWFRFLQPNRGRQVFGNQVFVIGFQLAHHWRFWAL